MEIKPFKSASRSFTCQVPDNDSISVIITLKSQGDQNSLPHYVHKKQLGTEVI